MPADTGSGKSSEPFTGSCDLAAFHRVGTFATSPANNHFNMSCNGEVWNIKIGISERELWVESIRKIAEKAFQNSGSENAIERVREVAYITRTFCLSLK